MVGNLIDNACKWAARRVRIGVSVVPPGDEELDPTLNIVVDDDGKGLSVAERGQIVQRGQRLDESKPGSGLGLAIVVDLAGLYGGNLKFDSAPMGGLRAELALPGVL